MRSTERPLSRLCSQPSAVIGERIFLGMCASAEAALKLCSIEPFTSLLRLNHTDGSTNVGTHVGTHVGTNVGTVVGTI